MPESQPKSKKPYLIAAALVLLILTAAIIERQSLLKEAALIQAQQSADLDAYAQALAMACQPQLQAACNAFYQDYLSVSPTVAADQTTIQSVQTDGANATIVLTTTPFVGPHVPVGEEQVTLSVSASGEITVTAYEHTVTHELPDHLADLALKPIPGPFIDATGTNYIIQREE